MKAIFLLTISAFLASCAGIKSLPGDAEVHQGRASIARGAWGPAFKAYERAISLQIQHRKKLGLTGPAAAAPLEFVKRARSLLKQKKAREAMVNYELAWELHRAAIDQGPSPQMESGEKAASTRRQGLFLESQAWSELNKNQDAASSSGFSNELLKHLVEAETLKRKGRPGLAQREVQKALDLDPDNSLALEMERNLRSGGKSKVSAANRRQAEALVEEGLDAYLDGRMRSARRAWEKALRLNPDNVRARNNLTRLKLEQ